MTRRKLQSLAALGVAFVLAAVVIGLFVPDERSSATANKPTTTTTVADGCNKQDVVSGILVSAGFTPDQFTIGEDKFDLTLPAALQAGHGRFADQPLTSKDALMSFLNSGDPAAVALLDTTVKLSGGTKEQASHPSNWVGFQLLTKSEWSGNTLFVDGKVTPAGTRHSAEGDIGWVFINPADCSTKANVVRVAIVRLGCGNPQAVPPNPLGSPPPPATPTTQPPSVTTTTVPSTTSTTVCTSGKCVPPTTVAPPPTTTPVPTTAPPNNGGQGDSGDGATNTTSPPTTTAPAPSPPTTSSPTTNPPPPPG